jgi:ABC-type antimicrobial peptide transport system permease subunit
VARYTAVLVLSGAAIGAPTALALSKLVKSFLFGITAQDPIAIVAATLTLIFAGALASFVPTWRATRVDPMVALRHE